MKGAQIQHSLKQSLKEIYEEREADNIASMVLEKITGHTRLDRLMNDQGLSDDQLNKLAEIKKRLLKHEPVQYVLGEAWFCGMKFTVDQSVLIPRPETEELVEWVIEFVSKWPAPEHRQYKLLDVGTGSGCIAIALAKKLPSYFEIWACDKSDSALTLARKNADAQQALVDFVPLDFLDPQQRKQLPHVDLVVSNPPYIPISGKKDMQNNVVDFEPSLALFVPDDDPLVFYKALANFGKEKLQAGGLLFAEIHEDFGNAVNELWTTTGYKAVECKKDMQGKDRFVKAQLPTETGN